MKRKAKQALRKATGGDLGQTGKDGGPVPRTDSEKSNPMLPAQRRTATRAVEMMIKLVRHKYRCSLIDAETDLSVLLRDQSVEMPDRRQIERDRRWACRVFGMHDRAAESGIILAEDHRHIAACRDAHRLRPAWIASPVSQRASILECGFDQCNAAFNRYTRELRVFAQLEQAERLRPSTPVDADIVHNPRAPCMLISTTGASGGNPSSSPRLIAIA